MLASMERGVYLAKARAGKYWKTRVRLFTFTCRDVVTYPVLSYMVLLALITSYCHSSAWTTVSPLFESTNQRFMAAGVSLRSNPGLALQNVIAE